jgi:hypothetical protein
MDEKRQTAYVLTREYSGEASYTVLRVLLDLKRAEEDLAVVEGDHGQTYKIHEVPLIVGTGK